MTANQPNDNPDLINKYGFDTHSDAGKSTVKDSKNALGVAESVDSHLQQIEDTTAQTQRRLTPEEQLFTEEELARIINPDKLKNLMATGDDLVNYLTSEIDKFDK